MTSTLLRRNGTIGAAAVLTSIALTGCGNSSDTPRAPGANNATSTAGGSGIVFSSGGGQAAFVITSTGVDMERGTVGSAQ